jgi:hypothetical protein
MKRLYLVTGECHPKTNASVRLERADYLDSIGDEDQAREYRAIVMKMTTEWVDQREHVKASLGIRKFAPMDPNEIVPPLGSPEHPLLWHDSGAAVPVCECGHFADFLCDAPVGRGKTCDIALCDCCRTIVSKWDQCPFHSATGPVEPR